MEEYIPGLISVIIPTYNRREMLLGMLETIFAQDYPTVEILVVDDGSSDGTMEAVSALAAERGNLRCFRNERNSGPGFSRKFGLRQAAGEYVVFADDDDYYTEPEFFSRAAAILSEDTAMELSAVAANARILYTQTGEWGELALPGEGRFSAAEYLDGFSRHYNKPVSTFTSVFRADALRSGGIEESIQVDDRVIYLRALLGGDFWLLSEHVGVYRVHESNFSRTVSADFTITLHRENRMIYDEICRRALLALPMEWWYAQAWIVLRFYIQNPGSSLLGLGKVFWWLLRQHISFKRDLTLFKDALGYWLYRRREKRSNTGQ